MDREQYKTFLDSGDTLRIYRDGKLLFSSVKERLFPLMEYLMQNGAGKEPLTIFDKVIGNAAACLAVKANAGEVYSPLGSELGVKTLEKYHVKYEFDQTVPYITKDDSTEMCPMEKLSMDKTPEEFYEEMKRRIEGIK